MASGGDGIAAELFQILKDDAFKVLHSICQRSWKTHQWPQDQKRSFASSPKERQYQIVFRLPYNCTHFTCLESFKLGFSSTWIENFQMFKLDLDKVEGPEIKLPTSFGLQKKQENSRKTSTSASLTHWNLWLCGLQQTGKFLKRWKTRPPYWPPEKPVCRSGSDN